MEIKDDMNNSLQLGHLKVIRVALSKAPLSSAVLEAIAAVDNILATEHNIKTVWKSLPKRPYQRQPDGEYVFEKIVK